MRFAAGMPEGGRLGDDSRHEEARSLVDGPRRPDHGPLPSAGVAASLPQLGDGLSVRGRGYLGLAGQWVPCADSSDNNSPATITLNTIASGSSTAPGVAAQSSHQHRPAKTAISSTPKLSRQRSITTPSPHQFVRKWQKKPKPKNLMSDFDPF